MARAAGHAAAEVLRLAGEAIKPGVSTLEIDQLTGRLIAERGCKSAFLGYRGFPGQLCISLNDEVVHGIGRASRIIREGDIVKIDVGLVKDGWIGDNATTVPVGQIPEEAARLLAATEESLHVAISHARHNGSLRDLCASVEKHVVGFGFSVVRKFVGHGVGRQLHEEPQVPNWGDPSIRTKLKAGMILAVEPMVNAGKGGVKILSDKWTAITADGALSSHFEHMVLVTEGEPEILTPRIRLFGNGL